MRRKLLLLALLAAAVLTASRTQAEPFCCNWVQLENGFWNCYPVPC